MVIDLPAHRRRFPNDGFTQVRRLRGRGVHDDGQRRLQRVGKIARMGSRLFRLPLIMSEKGVQFLYHG